MKKLLFLLVISFLGLQSFSQNAIYISAMEKNIAILDTTRNLKVYQDLANKFERIANSQKTEWLPNYYAAYCYVNMAYSVKGNIIDTYCDKAEKFINQADLLKPNNSEVYTIKAQIASARISVNPKGRGKKYNDISQVYIESAKKLNPNNPRIYFTEGTNYYYKPPFLGGSKEKAKNCFEKCIKLDKSFKAESNISPHWGKKESEYFISLCNKSLK